MKAFHFQLEKALRWREAQLDIEKARAADALARISGLQTTIEHQRSEVGEAGTYITQEPSPAALASYAGFLERHRARSRQLKSELGAAKKALAVEMARVIEANRKLHLLEKLKSAEQDRWRREFDRDVGQFADEAFLGRLESGRRKDRQSP